VCFAARDEAERVALIGTTVLLTSMPVVMIGALIYWIARRSRELDEEQATRAPEGHDSDSSTLRDGNRPATQAEVIPLHRA
jgi:hypothetical protein